MQLVFVERVDLDDLIDQLQPGVALAVIEHHAEVLRGGMGVKRFAVGKCHVIAQGEGPDFAVRRVGPAFCQPGFYRAIRLILYQRLIDHALGVHLVGRIEVRVERPHVDRPGGGDFIGRGAGQQRGAGE